MNAAELFGAVLIGALAMVTPALMLVRAVSMHAGEPYAPDGTPVTPVTVVEQHLHLHYHADGAVVRNGERPAALITCRKDAA